MPISNFRKVPSRFDNTKCAQDQNSVSNTADVSKYPQFCYQCEFKTCSRCSADAECFRKMPVSLCLQHFELSISTQLSSYSLELRIQCVCAQSMRTAMLFTSPCSQCVISPKGFADPGGFEETASAKFGTWDGGFSMPQPPAIASRKLVLYPAHRCTSKVSFRPTC